MAAYGKPPDPIDSRRVASPRMRQATIAAGGGLRRRRETALRETARSHRLPYREGPDWRYRTLDAPDAVLALEAIAAEISLADIYRDSGVQSGLL